MTRLIMLAMGLAIATATATLGDAKKNLIYIISDDLRPELNLAYDQTHMITPNLDRLASKSVAFLAYAAVAVCCPSRSSFMTGRRPNVTGVFDNDGSDFRDQGLNGSAWHTVPGHLKDSGWLTLGGGKTFHPNDPPNWDGNRSFDRNLRDYFNFDYFLKDRLCPSASKPVKIGQPISSIDTWCPLNTSSDPSNPLFYDSHLANYTTGSIDLAVSHSKASGSPFAIYAGFARPHVPHRVPLELFEHYFSTLSLTTHAQPPTNFPPIAYHRQGLYNYSTYDDPVGSWFVPNFTSTITPEQQRTARAAYYASVTWMDMQVGRILDSMDQNSLWDNTVVVFHGDHGWELGEFSMLHKETNLEIGTRVPLLVYDPSTPASSRGQRSTYLAELLDMGVTVFDLVGAPPPENEPVAAPFMGRSLRQALQSPFGPWDGSAGLTAFSQFPRCHRPGIPDWENNPIQGCDGAGDEPLMGYAVRTPDWRHVRWMNWNPKTFKTDWTQDAYAEELYPHTGDNGTTFDVFETDNVAGDPANAGVIKQLTQLLLDIYDH